MKIAKPFIKWAGGKGQLIGQLEQFLPKGFSNWKDATYVEPFVGGGAMLFHMLQTYRNISHAVINDINIELATCYRIVKTACNELIDALQTIEYQYFSLCNHDSEESEREKEYYLQRRDEYNSKRSRISPVETAALFIFLNKTCFNGLYRVKRKGEFNVPFGNQKRPAICDRETLLADSELLQRVEILSGDYTGTFQNYGPNTLYYFDPPYRPLNATSSFNDYSKEPFNDGEQVRLKEFCDRINQECQHFMVSNSDCMQTGDPFFDNLYSSYQIERVSASRAINSKGTGRGKISELLIHNR